MGICLGIGPVIGPGIVQQGGQEGSRGEGSNNLGRRGSEGGGGENKGWRPPAERWGENGGV